MRLTGCSVTNARNGSTWPVKAWPSMIWEMMKITFVEHVCRQLQLVRSMTSAVEIKPRWVTEGIWSISPSSDDHLISVLNMCGELSRVRGQLPHQCSVPICFKGIRKFPTCPNTLISYWIPVIHALFSPGQMKWQHPIAAYCPIGYRIRGC